VGTKDEDEDEKDPFFSPPSSSLPVSSCLGAFLDYPFSFLEGRREGSWQYSTYALTVRSRCLARPVPPPPLLTISNPFTVSASGLWNEG